MDTPSIELLTLASDDTQSSAVPTPTGLFHAAAVGNPGGNASVTEAIDELGSTDEIIPVILDIDIFVSARREHRPRGSLRPVRSASDRMRAARVVSVSASAQRGRRELRQ